MKKITILLVIAIAIIALFVIMVNAGPTWTDDTEFGEWGQEIIIIYDDQTTYQLGTLSVWHNDKQISSSQYQQYYQPPLR